MSVDPYEEKLWDSELFGKPDLCKGTDHVRLHLVKQRQSVPEYSLGARSLEQAPVCFLRILS